MTNKKIYLVWLPYISPLFFRNIFFVWIFFGWKSLTLHPGPRLTIGGQIRFVTDQGQDRVIAWIPVSHFVGEKWTQKKHHWTWWFKPWPFWGWLSDPFKWLSDLQLGDEKVTLNHLDWGFSYHPSRVIRGPQSWEPLVPREQYGKLTPALK